MTTPGSVFLVTLRPREAPAQGKGRASIHGTHRGAIVLAENLLVEVVEQFLF